ncbi:hypothetical protein [Marinagarivorans algicola]|uniref:hypothetical protein n=1 Tax=Marinagarivorans algicola TaxID=1513270 RepID=UPI0006B9353A|nr:hypothetical protein [Marinagarivorans algicola]
MKKLLLLPLLFLTSMANAAWLDTQGKVTRLITYAGHDTIPVTLDTAGTDVSECSNKADFVISQSISPEGRARMYAYLLAAKTTGSLVTLSYNHQNSCEPWDANPAAYRKIMRLQ